MTDLQRWAKEKKCCCTHPERTLCAEEQSHRRLPLDDVARSFERERLEEIEPCECSCHEDFFEDEEDTR